MDGDRMAAARTRGLLSGGEKLGHAIAMILVQARQTQQHILKRVLFLANYETGTDDE
jgi:ABC-type hemin transport system ATPase subunit